MTGAGSFMTGLRPRHRTDFDLLPWPIIERLCMCGWQIPRKPTSENGAFQAAAIQARQGRCYHKHQRDAVFFLGGDDGTEHVLGGGSVRVEICCLVAVTRRVVAIRLCAD